MSDRLFSADGHTLVRFEKTRQDAFIVGQTYISLVVRHVHVDRGMSKYGPYLYGALGQSNFGSQTRLVGVFSPALEAAHMPLAGAVSTASSQVGAPLHIDPEPDTSDLPNPVNASSATPLGAQTAPLRASSFKRLDRRLILDKQLVPRLVYRGDGPLQIGFGAVLQKDYLADTLGVLESMVKAPFSQFVSAAAPALGLAAAGLDMADTVHSAFSQLNDRKGATQLGMLDGSLAMLQGVGGELMAGDYALLARDKAPDGLEVEPKTGRLMKSNGREFDDAPYVVFQLRRERNRPDWNAVPELNSAWRTLEGAVMEGSFDGALDAFRRSVYLCRDLTPADSKLVFEAAREKVAPLLRPAESLAFIHSLGTLGSALKQTYDTLRKDTPAPAAPVTGMATFQRCLDVIVHNEGGYSNHAADRGGATNIGVTQATYDRWRQQAGKGSRDVREISWDEIEQIYFEGYWLAAKCDRLEPIEVALVALDAAVNHGPARSIRFLQRGAGLPVSDVDGAWGPRTQAAIAATPPRRLVERALDARWSFFERIMANDPSQEAFRNGWRNRVEHLRDLTARWASGQESLGIGPLDRLPLDQIADPVFDKPREADTT